jgi:hypothetical protein
MCRTGITAPCLCVLTGGGPRVGILHEVEVTEVVEEVD